MKTLEKYVYGVNICNLKMIFVTERNGVYSFKVSLKNGEELYKSPSYGNLERVKQEIENYLNTPFQSSLIDDWNEYLELKKEKV